MEVEIKLPHAQTDCVRYRVTCYLVVYDFDNGYRHIRVSWLLFPAKQYVVTYTRLESLLKWIYSI